MISAEISSRGLWDTLFENIKEIINSETQIPHIAILVGYRRN
jgi:hypothetical protein